MSHNGSNESDAQARASTTAEGEDLDLLTMIYYYALFGASAPQAEPEMPSYVQPPFNAPSGSGTPLHPSPPYPPQGPHPSQNPRHHTPDFFATAEQLGWEHWFQPQVPSGIPEAFPPVAAGTDARRVGYAASPANGHHTPSEPALPPSVVSAPAPGSETQRSVTEGATRPTAPGAPGPSTPVVLEEITHPPELPAVSSCDFGGTLTLGDALKKDFSRMPGDSARRAFPSQNCAAKLAFWLVFNLGSDFRSRRKQVTVVTTRKGVVEQPSKARLAYLVAHEMEKYLRECTMRQTPFPYTLDDIVLRRIDLVSKGTLRPRLYIQVRRPRSIRTPSAATC